MNTQENLQHQQSIINKINKTKVERKFTIKQNKKYANIRTPDEKGN